MDFYFANTPVDVPAAAVPRLKASVFDMLLSAVTMCDGAIATVLATSSHFAVVTSH